MNVYVKIAFAAAIPIGVISGVVADRIAHRKETPASFDLDIPDGVNVYDEYDCYDDDCLEEREEEPKKYVGRQDPGFHVESPRTGGKDYTKYYDINKYYEIGETPADTDGDEFIPYVTTITEEEFVKGTGNLDGYTSVTGTWFPEDRILAGWDDKLEEKNVEETVGTHAILAFEQPETKAVYVKNDLLKVLFEIVRGSGSFESARTEEE